MEEKDIAIIGIGVKVCGADSPEELWTLLENGVDAITDMPANRVNDIKKYYESIKEECPESFYKAAYLNHIDEFDYHFFGITPKEAELMDPNQRLFLETAWSAIDDAGMINDIQGSRTGVFVGCSGECEFRNIVKAMEPALAGIAIPGNCPSMIPGRVAFLLDLKGPNLTVNTVCSSSLVSVHLACQAIRNGECDMAIAGGVQIYIRPIKQTKTGVESFDGKTRSFDENSSGTGTGEGVLVILLKPLSRAIEDKDHIYSVVKGSALNHDGYSIGVAAPNPLAQEDVIVRAWKDAGVNPSQLSYIEAHGTGTKLGDPVEIEGLTRAFERYTKKHQFCGIGSIKTNFGHLDYASGIAGLIKASLMLTHETMVPSLHYSKPNPNIDFEHSPVFVNTERTKWVSQGFKRKCGVSAFGYSGTNCHVILEEAPERVHDQFEECKTRLFTVSAKSETALMSTLRSYLDYLEKGKGKALDDFTYTLNVTKKHYNYRIAIVFETIDELIRTLTNVSEGGPRNKDSSVWQGCFREEGESVEIDNIPLVKRAERDSISLEANRILREMKIHKTNSHDLLSEAACCYVKGADPDWKLLYENEKRLKVYVPPYCFDRIRCWPQASDRKNICRKQADKISYAVPEEKVKITGMALQEITKVDIQIADLIGYVVGCKNVDFMGDYYQLGGDSITAIELTHMVNETFHIQLGSDEIMRCDSIKEFSRKVESMVQTGNENQIKPATQRMCYPVSSAQKRMYLAQQMYRDSIDYNIASIMKITGKLDVWRLEDSLQKLVNNSEVLRTVFLFQDHELVQKVLPEYNVRLEYEEDLGKVDKEDNQMKNFVKPFHLNELPLFRMKLVKRDEREYLLLCDFHHIVTDGRSINLMIEELIALYAGKENSETKLQYKDYAVWQQEYENHPIMQSQKQYWLQQLNGELPELGIKKENNMLPEGKKGDVLFFTTDSKLMKALKEMSEKSGNTLFVLLLSVYYLLLYKQTRQEKIIVGTVVSGRTRKEIENIPGVFVNTIPLLVQIKEDETFVQFAGRVKKIVLEGIKNQDYPYEKIVESIGRNGSQAPLFQTMFMLQNRIKMKYEMGNITVERMESAEYAAKFEITLNAYESEDKLHLSMNYRQDHFKKETMEELLKDYVVALNIFSSDMDCSIMNYIGTQPYEDERKGLPEIYFNF